MARLHQLRPEDFREHTYPQYPHRPYTPTPGLIRTIIHVLHDIYGVERLTILTDEHDPIDNARFVKHEEWRTDDYIIMSTAPEEADIMDNRTWLPISNASIIGILYRLPEGHHKDLEGLRWEITDHLREQVSAVKRLDHETAPEAYPNYEETGQTINAEVALGRDSISITRWLHTPGPDWNHPALVGHAVYPYDGPERAADAALAKSEEARRKPITITGGPGATL